MTKVAKNVMASIMELDNPKITFTNFIGETHNVCDAPTYAEVVVKYCSDKSQELLLKTIETMYAEGETNLNKMLACAFSEPGSYEPHIVYDSKKHPFLAIDYDKYIELTNNDYFSVVVTPYNRFEIATSATLLSPIAQEVCKLKTYYTADLCFFYYLNLLQVGRQFDAFNRMMETESGRNMVTTFVLRSVQFYDMDIAVPHLDIIKDLESNEIPGFESIKCTYRLPLGETSDICRLNVYSNFKVGVTYHTAAGYFARFFELPEPHTYELTDGVFTEILRTLVTYALSEIGIKVDYAGFSFDGDLLPMTALGLRSVFTLYTLGGVGMVRR